MTSPPTTMAPTAYVPAVMPGGDVPLRNALAFIALAQEVTEEALVALVDRERSGDAARGGPSPPPGPRPVSVDEQAGTGLRTDQAEEGPRRRLSGFELYDAVVHSPTWAPRFAAVVLWAADPSAPDGVRDVTEEEAAGRFFPTRAFAEAWDPFYLASAALTDGLIGTPTGTGSSSAEATTTTPATPS